MTIRPHMKKILAAAVAAAALSSALQWAPGASAQSAEELQSKIQERNKIIQQLNGEIQQYQGQINKVNREANTLQNAIKTLDLSQKKLSTELQLTVSNIGKTELTLQELAFEIQRKEDAIRRNSRAVAEVIRTMNEASDTSIIETLLTKPNISAVWNDVETMEQFESEMRDYVMKLKQAQTELIDKRDASERKKSELLGLKSTLADKKTLVEQNKQQKSSLLTQTKSKEEEYKRLLAQKAAQKAAFEKELFEYEARLKMVIDKSKIAPAGKGVLQWPLDVVRVTQYFGRTVDAARLYTSGSHNGIDLGAARGTPVKSALTGVIKGIGNTDAQPGCYSYGKWVLIEHGNGLSTLYAHLDLIKVSLGETVATGQVIGYSGQTGYATGPHLHFTVYATQGVSVARYAHSVNCQQVSIPISDQKAYLDPMLYL